MGWAKDQLIDEMENKRFCPECGMETFWFKGDKVKCRNCGYEDEAKNWVDCELGCGNVVKADDEVYVCFNCLESIANSDD